MTVAEQNPFVEAAPWGIVEIGERRLPGTVVSIDGAEKPEEWNVQKPSDKAGATTVWKGTQLADTIKIVLALATAEQYRDYEATRNELRPKLGTKPPTHLIVSPIINFAGITRVSCRNVGAPKWIEKGAYWTGEISLVEYSPPKPANTGAAGPGGAGGKTIQKAAPDPNKDLNDEIEDTVDEIKKLQGGD
jgi:hypothetical protein